MLSFLIQAVNFLVLDVMSDCSIVFWTFWISYYIMRLWTVFNLVFQQADLMWRCSTYLYLPSGHQGHDPSQILILTASLQTDAVEVQLPPGPMEGFHLFANECASSAPR